MKFQYVSDLHLEFFTEQNNFKFNLPVTADCLLLAGDIGNPRMNNYSKFLDDVSKKFELVFLIAGNHEYYSDYSTIPETDMQIRNIVSKYSNIHFLQNDIFNIPNTNISIFGSTLWTQIDPTEDVKNRISDYIRIPEFTINKCSELHQNAISILKEKVDTLADRKWIVLVHHMPQKRLIDKRYRHYRTNSAFASDIPFLDKTDNIVAVVYGHTHTPSIQGKYYCNPIGYPMENEHNNLGATFEIDN